MDIVRGTLLTKFIEKKVFAYEEPERKGTPRGDPIGFSRKKYEATLYMLTNTKLKDMADYLGMSYGLLRKWKTEDTFNDLVNRHTLEFCKELLEAIKTALAEQLTEKNGRKIIESKNISAVQNAVSIILSVPIMSDLLNYSQYIKTVLKARGMGFTNGNMSYSDIVLGAVLLYLLYKHFGYSDSWLAMPVFNKVRSLEHSDYLSPKDKAVLFFFTELGFDIIFR